MADVAELLKKRREDMIKIRTRQEMELAAFADGLKKVDPKVFEGKIEIPEDLSLRAFLPEFYKDDPDPEVYAAQYEKMDEFLTKINNFIKEINEEAYRCLSEYQALASKQ